LGFLRLGRFSPFHFTFLLFLIHAFNSLCSLIFAPFQGITALEKLLSRLSVPATEAKVGGKGGGGGGGKGGGGRGEGRGSRKEGGQKRRKGATSGKKWYLRRGEGEGGKEGGVESTEEEIAVAQIWREGGKEGGKDGGKEGGREELDAVLAIVEAGACRVGGEGGEGQLKDRLGALLAGREEDIRRCVLLLPPSLPPSLLLPPSLPPSLLPSFPPSLLPPFLPHFLPPSHFHFPPRVSDWRMTALASPTPPSRSAPRPDFLSGKFGRFGKKGGIRRGCGRR
jgi:hypothetical protein